MRAEASPDRPAAPAGAGGAPAVSGGPVGLVDQALRVLGTARVPVSGQSMLPTLTAGQRVVVHRVDGSAVRPGDVVAFRFAGRLVLHRVYSGDAEWVVTAGDNMDLVDAPIRRRDVLGVVRGLPPRPAPRRWPGRPDPEAGGPVDVWLLSAHPVEVPVGLLPPGWRVRHRPRHGIGVAEDVLAEVRAAVAHRPCVGITRHAVHHADEVLAGPLPAHTRVLLGCPFGLLDGGQAEHAGLTGRLLPPDLAGVHVRLGPAGVPVDPLPALRALVDAVAAVPAGGRP